MSSLGRLKTGMYRCCKLNASNKNVFPCVALFEQQPISPTAFYQSSIVML